MRKHKYRRNDDGSIPPPPGYEACEMCGDHVRAGHLERHWGITHNFGKFDPVSAGRKGGLETQRKRRNART